jgi:hypothetical protein
MHWVSVRQVETENLLCYRVDEWEQGVRGRIHISVKFRINSARWLSILELMKIRKDSKIKVSKGKILSFGRRMDDISSGRAKALHNRHIWRRDTYVNHLSPSDFVGPMNLVCLSYRRWIPWSPKVTKLIWAVDLRIPGSYPERWNYNVVSQVLTALGGQGCCNVKTPPKTRVAK